MSGNSFGDVFKITTFGESHGLAIGCVIDGCPSGVVVDLSFIQSIMNQRRPGSTNFVSPRNEADVVKIISGVYEGKTTGAPIFIMIDNHDHDSKSYHSLKRIYRPGHANFTYLEKFGIFDPQGGGRASARETAARVAAGALALLVLKEYGIEIEAYLTQIGNIKAIDWNQKESKLFCPDSNAEIAMKDYIEKLKHEGDSTGGIVTCIIKNIPSGLGEPVFDRFEAVLAHAMLSIPATKGFEIGEGFSSCFFKGSTFNDQMLVLEDKISFISNHAGGTLGGITTGQNVIFNTVFKPTSSIKKTQHTVTLDKQNTQYALDQNARHDPCVAIRGVCVVKAMAACVTCDMLLKARLNRLHHANNSQNNTTVIS